MSSTPVTAELVGVYKNINIVNYALFVPTLSFNFGILAKMLLSNDRDQF
jgi:hypothetical protein